MGCRICGCGSRIYLCNDCYEEYIKYIKLNNIPKPIDFEEYLEEHNLQKLKEFKKKIKGWF